MIATLKRTRPDSEEGAVLAELMFGIALFGLIMGIYLSSVVTGLNAMKTFEERALLQQQLMFAETYVNAPNTREPFRATMGCEGEEDTHLPGLQIIPPSSHSCVIIEGHPAMVILPEYNAPDYNPEIDKVQHLLPAYKLTIVDASFMGGVSLTYDSEADHWEEDPYPAPSVTE